MLCFRPIKQDQIAPSTGTARSSIALVIFSLATFASLSAANAATWYVNPRFGRDTDSGKKNTEAFKTVNRACSVVEPGDTVILAEGVYFENVNLWKLGTTRRPITFKGETRTKNNVTITGANPEFREGSVPWTLVDANLDLYSAPCNWSPGRVLYSQADLYPYASLNDLKTFTTDGLTPGPTEGFYHDSAAKRLYVRLNPRWGSEDPARNIMKVGPAAGGGPNGIWITDPSGANFVIHNQGSGNIIFDGITFETPRVAGIATKVSDIIVQNCYFLGCRSAVAGLGSTSQPINNVTVQYCEYTLFPTYNDVVDEVERAYQNQKLYAALPDFWWWQRKTMRFSYEVGFVLGVGDNWKIKNNYLHDVVDALSAWGLGNSQYLEISGNVIARTIDNAVEIGKGHENHMYVHDNVILDSFEAINYEPMNGIPWPSSLYVAHNVIADTSQNASPWKYIPFERGALKFVIGSVNWDNPDMANVSRSSLAIPSNGVVVNNNTILIYNGNLFDLGGVDPLKLYNVHFSNNLFVSKYAFSEGYRTSNTFYFDGFDCLGNIVAPASDNLPGPAARVAGDDGQSLQLKMDEKLSNPASYNFRPVSGSPLLGSGVRSGPGLSLNPDVGAYSANGPATLPVAGIQPDPGSDPSTRIPNP